MILYWTEKTGQRVNAFDEDSGVSADIDETREVETEVETEDEDVIDFLKYKLGIKDEKALKILLSVIDIEELEGDDDFYEFMYQRYR